MPPERPPPGVVTEGCHHEINPACNFLVIVAILLTLGIPATRPLSEWHVSAWQPKEWMMTDTTKALDRQAFDLYHEQKWAEAAELFEQLSANPSGFYSVQTFKDRAAECRRRAKLAADIEKLDPTVASQLRAINSFAITMAKECSKHTEAARKREAAAAKKLIATLFDRKPLPGEVDLLTEF